MGKSKELSNEEKLNQLQDQTLMDEKVKKLVKERFEENLDRFYKREVLGEPDETSPYYVADQVIKKVNIAIFVLGFVGSLLASKVFDSLFNITIWVMTSGLVSLILMGVIGSFTDWDKYATKASVITYIIIDVIVFIALGIFWL